MCGITGFVDFKGNSSKDILSAMVSTLRHRGPDDRGFEVVKSDSVSIGLGQTRLSIIDLSPAGHQPMASNHMLLIFNGEIYNYHEIRKELEVKDYKFSGYSDTEVILQAFQEWGVSCVHKFIGMFVFAVYDQIERQLYIFRDRAGVKPLFYYRTDDLLLFSSELKALCQHPSFEKKMDTSSIRAYFDLGYIPSPYSIFEKTYKLEPGKYIKLDLNTNELKLNTYWNVKDYYKKPKLTVDYNEAKDHLHQLLQSACKYRMVSDVPVGVFLSGGYDSTAVTALLQHNSSENLKTFTIGFDEGNNEAPFARKTAAYLGTDHHEHICTTKEAQNIIPELPYFYDEPFADSSAIPTILVSRFAKNHVKVALSADAGDELFAGYERYNALYKSLQNINKIPSFLKKPSKQIFSFIAQSVDEKHIDVKHKLTSIAKALHKNKSAEASQLYWQMNSFPESLREKLFTRSFKEYDHDFFFDAKEIADYREIPLVVDYMMYLQNDILTKVDRATMSVSLEGREPLLDHRLIEYTATLPFSYKQDGHSSKRILKDIVHEYVPKSMMDRPKKGFSLPIYRWLNGDLSYLIDEFLNEEALSSSGVFNLEFVSSQVRLFKEGKLYYKTFIWKLLMFQMWYEQWMKK